jgi:hypothetical protein
MPTRESGEYVTPRGFGHFGLVLLAVIGVLVILIEIALHVWAVFTGQEYELNHWVLITGALMGFAGCFGLDPKRSGAGFKLVVDGSTKILEKVPRFGRRSTDAIAVPSSETKVTAVPSPPAPPVQVPFQPEQNTSGQPPVYRGTMPTPPIDNSRDGGHQ